MRAPVRKGPWGAGVAALVAATALGGCGGGDSGAPLAERSIATQVRLLREDLVSRRAIEALPARSLRRAFLGYWRSVQFADVDRAVASFAPDLREDIGVELLALTIRFASDLYRSQVPLIDEMSVQGDSGTVRYFAAAQSDGSLVRPLAMNWRRSEGRWRITYSAALDGELRFAAQTRAQANFRPGSPRIDPRAIRAGERAASLQAAHIAERRQRTGGQADEAGGGE